MKHLGCNVVGGAANCSLLLTLGINLRGQPKVANADAHMSTQEQVSKLEVAMDDVLGVQVLQSEHKLIQEVSHFWLCEPLTTFHHFHESLVGAKLHDHVVVVCIFEMAQELDDVRVVERSVNLDFGHQLFSGAGAREGTLLHHLAGIVVVGVQVGEDKAASKAPFAKQLPSAVRLGHFSSRFSHHLLVDQLGHGLVEAFGMAATAFCCLAFLVSHLLFRAWLVGTAVVMSPRRNIVGPGLQWPRRMSCCHRGKWDLSFYLPTGQTGGMRIVVCEV